MYIGKCALNDLSLYGVSCESMTLLHIHPCPLWTAQCYSMASDPATPLIRNRNGKGKEKERENKRKRVTLRPGGGEDGRSLDIDYLLGLLLR